MERVNSEIQKENWKNMDSTICSCPKCNCIDEPEIIIKGEAVLSICPKCKVVRSKQPWL